jgi:SAM-dependent methyltransferase
VTLKPPMSLMYDGPAEEWENNGAEYFRYYIDLCDLQPYESMLDVGSGLGRKTVPLLDYLTVGKYVGIDCKQIGVNWCRENITPNYPNFQFQYVDVYAAGYNRLGRIGPGVFRFPFPDDSFDFVVANSLFTHMQFDGLENYTSEISRVVKPTGRCLLTYFIQNAPHPTFPHGHGYGWMANPEMPEEAISYRFDVIALVLGKADLIIKNLYAGTWHTALGLSHQDILIVTKAKDLKNAL